MVLPDGCCDLILRAPQGQPAQCFVSDLVDAPYTVATDCGESFQGYRLRPGAQVDEAGLVRALGQGPAYKRLPVDDASVLPLLDTFVRLDARVTEALASLSEATCVAAARRHLGVSERRLERMLLATTGRPPSYWKGLARVRQAARALAGPLPLAAIAADHGFADQAHLSRACKRWLGLPPGKLRHSPTVLEMISEPGYG